jgi:hypothetical protein
MCWMLHLSCRLKIIAGLMFVNPRSRCFKQFKISYLCMDQSFKHRWISIGTHYFRPSIQLAPSGPSANNTHTLRKFKLYLPLSISTSFSACHCIHHPNSKQHFVNYLPSKLPNSLWLSQSSTHIWALSTTDRSLKLKLLSWLWTWSNAANCNRSWDSKWLFVLFSFRNITTDWKSLDWQVVVDK